MTEEQLSALLRLKRYEQPPAEYFDQLLRDIHRRQRAELLRRPLWQIAADRVQTFFSEHSMGHVSYAGAMAAVLVLGIAAIGVMTSAGNTARKTADIILPKPTPVSSEKLITMQPSEAPKLGSQPFATLRRGVAPAVDEPRYVIDARPVSYEPSSSFNF